MAHTVRITTTTTENSNVLVLNTGYMRTSLGLLKVAELLLGIVTVGISAYYYANRHIVHAPSALFFLLMAVAFLICTASLLLSIVISWTTGSLIAKTLFELIYHSVATILLGAAAITMLVCVSKYEYTYKAYGLYGSHLTLGILGLVNAFCYLGSSVLAQRSYRGI